jgi:hypothetical protein
MDHQQIGWALVGQIVNSWAMIDQCADEMLLAVGHADEAAIAKLHWKQLSAKLDRLRELVGRERGLLPFSSLAKQILCDAAASYESRNDLVHGTAWFEDIHRVHYSRWHVKDGKMRLVRRTLRMQDLMNFALRSAEIAKHMHALAGDWKRHYPLPDDAIEAAIRDS